MKKCIYCFLDLSFISFYDGEAVYKCNAGCLSEFTCFPNYGKIEVNFEPLIIKQFYIINNNSYVVELFIRKPYTSILCQKSFGPKYHILGIPKLLDITPNNYKNKLNIYLALT